MLAQIHTLSYSPYLCKILDQYLRVVLDVTHVLDRLSEKLHTEMAQKLTATDSLMKENISKLVRSRVSHALHSNQAPEKTPIHCLVMGGYSPAAYYLTKLMQSIVHS